MRNHAVVMEDAAFQFPEKSMPAGKVRVVLFSGGRGSRVLSKELIRNPQVQLTLAINGYDDGASTGEIRRFLKDSLGPSDFRKNASRMARELQSCAEALIDLLDLRFPPACSPEEAQEFFSWIQGSSMERPSEWQTRLPELFEQLNTSFRSNLVQKLLYFRKEMDRTARSFSFSDCSLGNLVFAGCFLEQGRNFNEAIASYCSLLNLPEGMILNVTDGANAFLVALDRQNRLLASEADIVNANQRNFIQDLYLIDRPLEDQERAWLAVAAFEEITKFLESRSKTVVVNHHLLDRISEADLILYSPGTQHSSLFPSYMTPGLGAAIAHNLTAIKILVTNVQEDAEIPDSSAVDIIEKAVRYLKEKDHRQIPTPCLITHYLINDPRRSNGESPYVPLGRLESLEDPRLVSIGNYEDGVTGHHDATKVLTPFVESILTKGETRTVAVFLMETASLNKITQTILEMFRGGIQNLPVSIRVFYYSEETTDPAFRESIPFQLCNLHHPGGLLDVLQEQRFDYVILFDSSGMYRGEDVVNLAALLSHRRLDAVWGSRRLSIRDIRESYKLRYRHNIVLGAISYIGSHLLSLVYLLLYGRYISDTLSGARAIRASYLQAGPIDPEDRCLNQKILSRLLRDRGEIFETPVQFFSLSPEKVKRTTVLDGVRSLLTILTHRFTG